MEYVDAAKIQEDEQKAIKAFKAYSYRERSNVNLPLLNLKSTVESSDPLERILKRLNSYDTPKPPPPLIQLKSSVPNLSFIDSNSMFAALKPHFDSILQFVK